MIKWLTNLITSKTVDNVFDKQDGLLVRAGGWIDGLNHTDEEKSEARQKMLEGVSKFVESSLNENTERSKTRRFVAVQWIKVELTIVLIAVTVAPFNDKLFSLYWQVATSDLMLWGTLSIIGFFFGPYMIAAHLSRTKK